MSSPAPLRPQDLYVLRIWEWVILPIFVITGALALGAALTRSGVWPVHVRIGIACVAALTLIAGYAIALTAYRCRSLCIVAQPRRTPFVPQ